jgi:UDP-2-acetamido-3-amino-2,3-dideoxy-glucuronate N-acetyltransferase
MNNLQYETLDRTKSLPRGIHPSVVFGKNVKIGIGCVIEEDVVIGDDCLICHYVHVWPGVYIGDRVELRSFAHIEYGVNIGDDVRVYQYGSITAGATLENKIWYGPQVISTNAHNIMVHHPDGNNWKPEPPYIKSGAIIATKSVLGPGVTIGLNSIVGMASLVRKDIPDNEIWYGHPAKYIRPVPEYLRVIR